MLFTSRLNSKSIKLKNLFIFLSCLLTFALSAQTQTSPDELIIPDLLKEDLSILKYNFEELHGAIYLYNSKATIDQKFKEIEANLTDPMSSIDFYRHVTPLLKLIGNGHTHIVPSKEFYNKMRSELLYFPLDLYLHGGTIYLLRNNSSDETLERASVIESINGKPTIQLISEIAKTLTRDGINESWPMTRATKRFSEFYMFSYGDCSEYSCTITTPLGESKKVILQGLTKSQVEANRKNRYKEKKNWLQLGLPAYTLEFEDSTAIMTLRTFSNKEIKKGNKMKSKKWFKQAFAKIKEKDIDKLIIDLRDNGGGDEEPTIELFSHLYNQEFTFYKDVYLERRKIPNGKLYEDNIFFLNIYAKLITKKKNGKFELKAKGLKPYQPAKEQYEGEVLVLTNPYSFSATGEMTAILKEHDRVTFIGEEPGGNPNQNTSGAMLILNLPHTGLRAVVPVVVFEMNVSFENTGRGVLPDYEIKNSINDEINGVDSVMKFAKEL